MKSQWHGVSIRSEIRFCKFFNLSWKYRVVQKRKISATTRKYSLPWWGRNIFGEETKIY